jgi:DNA ligase D-like protein (predicted ligase)
MVGRLPDGTYLWEERLSPPPADAELLCRTMFPLRCDTDLRTMAAPLTKADFIDPMLLLRTDKLPEGPQWQYEVKLDGYRAIAFKSGGKVHLRSRNDKDFNTRYPAIAKALAGMPDETVIDGEVVALDASGRPSFNALQNHGSSTTPILYYMFDVMIIDGQDVMAEPLKRRRELLQTRVLSRLRDPIRESPVLEASLADLIRSVKAQRLEGIVAKRIDSRYEPGQRSGAWQKMRVNHAQEFVIGGYTPVGRNFDAIIFGYYDDEGRLLYAARTRNGFTPASRDELFRKFRGLETAECPFANLPEARSGRWGEGLTAEKMADCRWLRPELVGQSEFVEWTADGHLRHSRFVALREDKKAREVGRI